MRFLKRRLQPNSLPVLLYCFGVPSRATKHNPQVVVCISGSQVQPDCLAELTDCRLYLPLGGKTYPRVEVSEGVARLDDAGGRMLATFNWPFSAPYWVLGIDPDYRWAVVGVPSRRYLWVLSRTPALLAEDEAKAYAVATVQGYDTKLLIKPGAAK